MLTTFREETFNPRIQCGLISVIKIIHIHSTEPNLFRNFRQSCLTLNNFCIAKRVSNLPTGHEVVILCSRHIEILYNITIYAPSF